MLSTYVLELPAHINILRWFNTDTVMHSLTRVAHTVLSCRVIIQIRSADRRDTDEQTAGSIVSSGLEFRTPPSQVRQSRVDSSESVYSVESAEFTHARQRSAGSTTGSVSAHPQGEA